MIQPRDLGAPPKFGTWRPGQGEAWERIASASSRVVLTDAPVGTGKSLIGTMTAKLHSARAVILTANLGLMKQYTDDGLAQIDIKGMSRYPCRALLNREGCDAGPCLDGEACMWRQKGCAYFDQEAMFRDINIGVTNYDYWFSHPPQWNQPFPLGERDMLICDEAHAIPDKLMKAAGVEFTEREVQLDARMEGWEFAQWQTWASTRREEALELLSRSTLEPSERRDVRSLFVRFDRLAKAQADAWAWEWNSYDARDGVSARFEPISPEGLAEPLLFRSIPKIILLSGTARKEMMGEMGIREFDYVEVPSPFEVRRRPIYWWETGVRVNQHTSETNLEFLVSKIDQWIACGRLEHKGIIHTVSYARAKFLLKHSRFAKHMLLHTSATTRDTVEKFKRMRAPSILVSPVVDTGWDFPYEAARWQGIMKIPYPPTHRGIALARQQHDNQYGMKHAIMVLQQMAGRIMRAPDDWGETVIFDDQMKYVYGHFRPWFHKWFREAYQPVVGIPSIMAL